MVDLDLKCMSFHPLLMGTKTKKDEVESIVEKYMMITT